ncbi:MAG TPA: hypothetical protein VGN63_11025 [Flavisolibacter sp.]|jgi:sucrose-6-phosphate hydrolase SacC (GH32 family)|nr:hypothetical protein [Flavisolibacter sp.]
MKRISLILLLGIATVFAACEKDDANTEGIDLSNTLEPYIEFTSTSAKQVKQGTATTVGFQMRTGLQQKVTVHYDVTGAVNLPNQTLVLDREATTGQATINIPANVIVAPATSATATVTLKRAVKEDGTELTLGAKNQPASQVVTLNIIP